LDNPPECDWNETFSTKGIIINIFVNNDNQCPEWFGYDPDLPSPHCEWFPNAKFIGLTH
jgi:hypothetical protein